MNGPQHLKEAERLAAVAVTLMADKKSDPAPTLTLALIHATLAAALATADSADGGLCRNGALWAQVAT